MFAPSRFVYAVYVSIILQLFFFDIKCCLQIKIFIYEGIIKNAINIFNETHGKNGFGFAEDKYSVGNGKLEIMLITLDGIYNDEITNDKIKGYVNELINLADTPEYFIEAKF